MKAFRGIFAALVVVAALLVAPAAQAANIGSVFGGLTCTPIAPGGIRACGGYVKTFDGKTKIDVNVFLPPAPASGPDGPYPLIGDFHGWGGSKQGLTTIEPSPGLTYQQRDSRIQPWAEQGYAVFSMSDRGWGRSCGKYDPEANVWPEACTLGYNHLMDDRYEVRDAQYLMGVLADEEVIKPTKIGVTGRSYGGGISMALAALRNREMVGGPGNPGTPEPWVSPEEEFPMEIAAAAPQWPWTDIAYALAPNGHNLDYVTESSYFGPQGNFGIGIAKARWIEGLYQAGLALSNFNTNDPEANIPGWRERLLGGEPYTDSTIYSIIKTLIADHSSFYINHSEAPAPTLIQSGWNDDLFPADEALRFYQRTRAQYPGDPISLFFLDDGHSRSLNKPADDAVFQGRLNEWFDHYLMDEGPSPSSSVEAMTTLCPKTVEPSEGPYTATNWSSLAPGEIRYQSPAAQSVEPGTGGPTESSLAFNPIPESTEKACAKVSGTDASGVANYRLPAAPAGGYTLMGSPTITATVNVSSPNAHVVARLVDVSPAGEESLVARGLYRPVGGTQEMVFQLHPQGYHFAEGHVAKLEILPSDYPYSLSSVYQVPITVSDLELRLPVTEQPGGLGGLVQAPAAKVVPAGYTLAAEYQQKESGGGGGGGGGGSSTKPPAPTIKIGSGGLAGKLSANGKYLFVPLGCSGDGACSGHVLVSTKMKGAKTRTTLGQGNYSIPNGATTKLRLQLTKSGRKIVADSKSAKKLHAVFNLDDSGRPTSLSLSRLVQLSKGGK